MLRTLFLSAAVLTFLALPAPSRAADEATGYIKAEVRGVLQFENGKGYFIVVKSKEEPARESRVWLWISEDKALVRQLQELTGKEVAAKGNLGQLPDDVRASVPPQGMYMRRFDIDAAKDK